MCTQQWPTCEFPGLMMGMLEGNRRDRILNTELSNNQISQTYHRAIIKLDLRYRTPSIRTCVNWRITSSLFWHWATGRPSADVLVFGIGGPSEFRRLATQSFSAVGPTFGHLWNYTADYWCRFLLLSYLDGQSTYIVLYTVIIYIYIYEVNFLN